MPTLQKWINLTCDPRCVAEIWNESQSSDKPLDIEIVATRVKEFCKLLTSLKPTNSDYIMLALKYYENGIETIDAELIKGDDLHRAGMFLRDEFIHKEKPLPSISQNSNNQELEAFLEQTTGWMPQAFAYEYTPWEEILGAAEDRYTRTNRASISTIQYSGTAASIYFCSLVAQIHDTV